MLDCAVVGEQHRYLVQYVYAIQSKHICPNNMAKLTIARTCSQARIPHAISAHGDGITDTNGVEPQSNQSNLVTSLLHFLSKVMQMHVARVTLPPNRGNAHLRLQVRIKSVICNDESYVQGR